MIICLCHGVSDRVLKDAIAKGAQSISDIKKICLIGEGCGQCMPVVEELICSFRQSSNTDNSWGKQCQKMPEKKK